MPLTDADLSQIESRANAATPGPWSADVTSDGMRFIMRADQRYVAEADLPRDEDFIAHARTDVPRLVAACRALKAVCEALVAERDAWRVWAGSGYGGIRQGAEAELKSRATDAALHAAGYEVPQ